MRLSAFATRLSTKLVSTPIIKRNALSAFFAVKQLAQQPQQAWARFVKGLVIFFIGLAVLIIAGGIHFSLDGLAMAVMLVGFVVAMTGYLAIFISRFNRLGPPPPPDL